DLLENLAFLRDAEIRVAFDVVCHARAIREPDARARRRAQESAEVVSGRPAVALQVDVAVDLLRLQAQRVAERRRDARLGALDLADRAQVEVVGQRRDEILGVRSAAEGEPVGHAHGERGVEVVRLELREPSIVAADPPALPVRLQAPRRADAEAETDPVGELVREEERREWLYAAGVAAVPSGQRCAADGFIQARAVVLEGKARPYQEPRGRELRTLE